MKRLLIGSVIALIWALLVVAEEGKEVSPENQGVSLMLLGSVSFMMTTFYLVNHPDEDMKKHSWRVISSTISIFSAVLFFQACQGVVEEYIIAKACKGSAAEKCILGVNLGHMFSWLLLLQLVLACISGAIGKEPTDKKSVTLSMKCWAVMMGHISGFSAINAFGVLQHSQWFAQDWKHALLVMPIAAIVLKIVFGIFACIRDRISKGDDGIVDEWEKMWDEEVMETEDDVYGLALSFLTVQAARYGFTGVFANVEGEDEVNHPNSDAWKLWGFGIAMSLLHALRAQFLKCEITPRLTSQVRNIMHMTFAWCFYNGTYWLIDTNLMAMGESAMGAVVLALIVSAVSFVMIFILDKIADSDSTGKEADKAIEKIILALGILIGFSWEKSFDVSVGQVAEVMHYCSKIPVSIAKLLMALLLMALVVPAWRIYILSTLYEIGAFEEEEEELIEEEGEVPEQKKKDKAVTNGNSTKKDERTTSRGLAAPLLARGASSTSQLTVEEKMREMERRMQQAEKDRERAKDMIKSIETMVTTLRQGVEQVSIEEDKEELIVNSSSSTGEIRSKGNHVVKFPEKSKTHFLCSC